MDIVSGSLRVAAAAGAAGQKLARTLFGGSGGDVAKAAEVERLRRRVANLEHRLEQVEERSAPPPEAATPADMPRHAAPPALPTDTPARRTRATKETATRTAGKTTRKAAAARSTQPTRSAP